MIALKFLQAVDSQACLCMEMRYKCRELPDPPVARAMHAFCHLRLSAFLSKEITFLPNELTRLALVLALFLQVPVSLAHASTRRRQSKDARIRNYWKK